MPPNHHRTVTTPRAAASTYPISICNMAAHGQDEPGLKRMLPSRLPSWNSSPNHTRPATWCAATETNRVVLLPHGATAYQEFLVLISQVAPKRKSNGKPAFLASIHSAGPGIVHLRSAFLAHICIRRRVPADVKLLSFARAINTC